MLYIKMSFLNHLYIPYSPVFMCGIFIEQWGKMSKLYNKD